MTVEVDQRTRLNGEASTATPQAHTPSPHHHDQTLEALHLPHAAFPLEARAIAPTTASAEHTAVHTSTPEVRSPHHETSASPQASAHPAAPKNFLDTLRDMGDQARRFIADNTPQPVKDTWHKFADGCQHTYAQVQETAAKAWKGAQDTFASARDSVQKFMHDASTRIDSFAARVQTFLSEKAKSFVESAQNFAQNINQGFHNLANGCSQLLAHALSPFKQKEGSNPTHAGESLRASRSGSGEPLAFNEEAAAAAEETHQHEYFLESIKHLQDVVTAALESLGTYHAALRDKKESEQMFHEQEHLAQTTHHLRQLQVLHPDPHIAGYIDHMIAALTDVLPDFGLPSEETMVAAVEREARRASLMNRVEKTQRTLGLLHDGLGAMGTMENAA